MSQYIHRKSKRKNGPFIALNCAAIPESLLESELFGHEKGAFTGAVSRRLGKFEEASGGTLLLDEVSEMHPQLQAKLLRAIQEREITRIGSNDAVKVDVRLIATSNRDLEAYVKSGGFREDLYFRLNVVNIRLPSLRERPGDIGELAQFFADKFAESNGMTKKKIAAATLDLMKKHPWKGNIRELENTLHRAVLMSMEDEIEPAAVGIGGATAATTTTAPTTTATPQQAAPVQNPGAVESLIGRTIADVERDMILNTLDHCLGNRTHAANILGISIRTLRNKLNQYKDEGVDVPAAASGE